MHCFIETFLRPYISLDNAAFKYIKKVVKKCNCLIFNKDDFIVKLSGGGKSSGTLPPRILRFSVFSIQKTQNPTGVVSPNFCRSVPGLLVVCLPDTHEY